MYPVACERNKYNGLITLLSLYPIKYLNELCLLYCSFLETNILLTSHHLYQIFLCFCCRSRSFLYFCCQNLCSSSRSFLYTINKKSKNDVYTLLMCIHSNELLFVCIHSNEWLFLIIVIMYFYYMLKSTKWFMYIY